MTRFKFTLEYDGGAFVGWQRQDNGMSVQQALEEAVFKTCGETATAHAAGRTDAGVHATGQVAHVDIEKEFTADKIQAALNFHLKPWPVAIITSEIAPPDFHARFSATGRAYLYRIINRRPPLALEEGRAWLVNAPLDATAMHEAAQVLVGKHDFSTFRASLCQAQSPVKTLSRLSVSRAGEEIDIIAEARSFLHHQVRNMVGTLRLVGEGKWSMEDVRRALEARDRTKGGPTAPPHGLYLTGVRYD
ncbi:tRNA pseudouridine(38-40) synthase TruA [Dongia deserti]|uniref:tRNA pseudouridine(38-40) synthase TruA n=1 Tax=Dongia deserti TaxID=2268030 RepID=UPI000E646612|nr:tRNA pseudouridine(38-40) synthase TruA [Dongia deserti]